VIDAAREDLGQRILMLAPTGKDAALTRSILDRAGVACHCCADLPDVCEELERGVGALLMAEEAVLPNGHRGLVEWLSGQPPWSDLPILVLARPGANSAAVAQSMDLLGNVTVLERPTRVAALVSTVRSALRARQRQYQIRDHLAERERNFETQALLAAIVTSSDDAIVSKTMEGIILTWNAGAERLFGYSAAETIGRPITMLIPPERQHEEPLLLERLGRGERIEHYETVRIAKDGRRLDISLTLSPMRDANGTIIGASKVARDISQRKRAEEALRDADRRKDEFLAILAHELRNPLAPIRNSLHILRLTNQHDPAAERVGEMMDRQVNHMVRLVDDLMEVSRITRGKIELRKEPVEVAGVVRSAVETSRPHIEAAGHQLALALPPDPLMLDGDPVRLTQVVANLLNNAAKYTEAGGQIWLTVRREGDRVAISVRDTGRGIPPDMLPRVFELFMQLDRNDAGSQGGLGIGLTLVKNLVEMHGGSVRAHSEGIGRGSEFVVRLPLAATPRPEGFLGPKARSSAVLAPRRVLVVDDNRDAADTMGMLLKLLGADVLVVYNGPDALQAVTTYQPAVVLLDIGMPGMDGYEVARRIRQQPISQDVRLIALTGWGQESDRNRSQAAGFDYHLIKPADVSVLETLLVSLESRPGSRRTGDSI
jgi:PAS domain S-box-containing protein